MLKLVSRFVLEALPYLLTALIAAVVVPGFLCSQSFGTKTGVTASVPRSGANAPELAHQGHAAFALNHILSDPAKMAGDKLAYR